MRLAKLLLLSCLLLHASIAEAGIFSKKEKPAGPESVVKLLGTLKNKPDADQRVDAASDLGEFDGKAYPEIVPALINALQRDSSSSVRRQAAESLGRIKPTSQEALQALEQASSQDDSTWVRLKARTALLGYRVSQPAPATAAKDAPSPAANANNRLKPVPVPQPLPKPPESKPLSPAPLPTAGLGKPTPVGTSQADHGPVLDMRQAAPVSRTKPAAEPLPPSSEDGPILVPPSP